LLESCLRTSFLRRHRQLPTGRPFLTYAPFRSMTGLVSDLNRSTNQASPGSVSLQRLQKREATFPGLPHPVDCAFNVFHVLDALFLSHPFRLFSAGNTLEISSSKVSPFAMQKDTFESFFPVWCWLSNRTSTLPSKSLTHLAGIHFRKSPLPPVQAPMSPSLP
jgi:hypothetical protein